MNQMHIFVSGHVQGVGYRYFVKSNALKLGLKGWVRNTVDGKVEAVFQGEQEIIEKMIALCRQGPFLAEVKNIEVVEEEPIEKLRDFTIRKD